jgi:hypothetical protein
VAPGKFNLWERKDSVWSILEEDNVPIEFNSKEEAEKYASKRDLKVLEHGISGAIVRAHKAPTIVSDMKFLRKNKDEIAGIMKKDSASCPAKITSLIESILGCTDSDQQSLLWHEGVETLRKDEMLGDEISSLLLNSEIINSIVRGIYISNGGQSYQNILALMSLFGRDPVAQSK